MPNDDSFGIEACSNVECRSSSTVVSGRHVLFYFLPELCNKMGRSRISFKTQN